MVIKILGLDPGLASTGWALLEGNLITGKIAVTEHYGVIKTKKWEDKKRRIEIPMRERIDAIGIDIQKVVAKVEPQFIAIEDFVFYGNRGKTTSTMPALIENIRMLGRALGYEVDIYTNAFWKQILLKNHIANKNQIQHYVHRKLGLSTSAWDKKDKGSHIRDSMALALTKWEFLKRQEQKNKDIPKKKSESVKTLQINMY